MRYLFGSLFAPSVDDGCRRVPAFKLNVSWRGSATTKQRPQENNMDLHSGRRSSGTCTLLSCENVFIGTDDYGDASDLLGGASLQCPLVCQDVHLWVVQQHNVDARHALQGPLGVALAITFCRQQLFEQVYFSVRVSAALRWVASKNALYTRGCARDGQAVLANCYYWTSRC